MGGELARMRRSLTAYRLRKRYRIQGVAAAMFFRYEKKKKKTIVSQNSRCIARRRGVGGGHCAHYNTLLNALCSVQVRWWRRTNVRQCVKTIFSFVKLIFPLSEGTIFDEG